MGKVRYDTDPLRNAPPTIRVQSGQSNRNNGEQINMATHRPTELERYSWLSKRIRTCACCGVKFVDRRVKGGRTPKYCSDACKQRAYRQAKKEELS